MKIPAALLLLLVVLAGCSKSGQSVVKPDTITIMAEPSPNDYAGTVTAYYQDEFGDSKTVHFKKKPGSSGYLPQTIKSRYPVWLRFTRGAQVPVYLVPGDTLQVKAAPRFNVDYTLVGERPGEINFYNQLDQQSLGMNLGDLMGVHQNETYFRPRTKMLNYLYHQRQAYLNRIKDSLALSPAFYQFIQTEITGTYLIGLLAPFYREQFSRQPIRRSYLDTLSQFYNSGYFKPDSLVHSSSVYRRSLSFYNRFLSREALGTPREMEVLYENARRKFTGQNRNYLLFSLLKEHLPQNLNMAAYLKRSKNDITYKPYIYYLDSLAQRSHGFNTKPELQNTTVTTLTGEQLTWRELLARHRVKLYT